MNQDLVQDDSQLICGGFREANGDVSIYMATVYAKDPHFQHCRTWKP